MKKRTLAIVALAAVLGGAFWFFSKSATSTRLPQIRIDSTDGHKLLIDGKPVFIKGVCYSPIPTGKDYEYNFWGDFNKPWLVDGKLMKEAGINTVRFYRMGKNPAEVRQVMDDLYQKFGIRSLVGTYLGFWSWPPPNYSDAEFTAKVKADTLEMVRLYKDSPAVLMWVLGNENNYSFDRDVQRWTSDAIDALPTEEAKKAEKARLYYSFVNDLAREIKKIDPNHPVALGVGEVASLSSAKENAPDIDVLAMIAYRGSGFGNLFRQVKQKYDKPVVMTEWGADSFNSATREPDEAMQSEFLRDQWRDIERNSGLAGKGEKNCLGGTVFEWNDEWWKGNENVPHTWSVQDEAGHWQNTSYTVDAYGTDKMNMNEEWWGLVALEPKRFESGVQVRVPKQGYKILKELWTRKAS